MCDLNSSVSDGGLRLTLKVSMHLSLTLATEKGGRVGTDYRYR